MDVLCLNTQYPSFLVVDDVNVIKQDVPKKTFQQPQRRLWDSIVNVRKRSLRRIGARMKYAVQAIE